MISCMKCTAKSTVGDEFNSNGETWAVIAAICPICGTYLNNQLVRRGGKKGLLETEKGKPIKDILIEEFNRLGDKTMVAKSLGVSNSTIERWMYQLDLRVVKLTPLTVVQKA